MGSRLSCHRRQHSSGAAGFSSVEPETEPTEDFSSESPASAQSTVEQTEPAAPEFPLVVGGDRDLLLDLVTPPLETNWELSELRLYVVWSIPGCNPPQRFAGLHWGIDRIGYAGILTLNSGHFGGIKWQRVFSIARGRELFLQEAHRHQVEGDQVSFYRWQQNSAK